MYVNPAFGTTRKRGIDLLRERAYGTFVVPTAIAPIAVYLLFLTYEDREDALRI